MDILKSAALYILELKSKQILKWFVNLKVSAAIF